LSRNNGETIPPDSQVFIDTNILLYSISEHNRFAEWCDELLDRIIKKELKGFISIIVLNELIHKLIIGEISQKKGIEPKYVVRQLRDVN